MIRRTILALVIAAQPALAQDTSESEGRGLMQRGLELFFKGFRDEMSPAMENMRKLAEEFGPAMQSFMAEMGPALSDLMEQVKDWSVYEAPEILPNGDIIIRRKPDAAPDRKTPDLGTREIEI